MATRYSGTVKVTVFFADRWDSANRSQYRGRVTLDDGRTWKFDDLFVHPHGASDAPEAYDRAAECALAFASAESDGSEDSSLPDGEFAYACGIDMDYSLQGERDAREALANQMAFNGDTAIVFRSLKARDAFYAAESALDVSTVPQ